MYSLRVAGSFAGALLLVACSAGGQPQVPPALLQNLAAAATADTAADPALGVLQAAAHQASDDAVLQERYALAAERSRQFAEALGAIDRAVALGAADPARLRAQGRIALEAGDAATALRAYRRATQSVEAGADSWSGLGVVQDLMHDHAEAQASYRAALRLAPEDWGVRGNLALSLLMSGQAADAVNVLDGVETDSSAPRRARDDLALALVVAGQRPRALRLLKVDLAPDQASALCDEMQSFGRWLAGQGAVPSHSG